MSEHNATTEVELDMESYTDEQAENHLSKQQREHLVLPSEHRAQTLRDYVEIALRNYFEHLDGHPASQVYELVLSEVEAPLLETVMEYTRGNQTKASNVLGLNRGTLRKKLKQYGLI